MVELEILSYKRLKIKDDQNGGSKDYLTSGPLLLWIIRISQTFCCNTSSVLGTFYHLLVIVQISQISPNISQIFQTFGLTCVIQWGHPITSWLQFKSPGLWFKSLADLFTFYASNTQLLRSSTPTFKLEFKLQINLGIHGFHQIP